MNTTHAHGFLLTIDTCICRFLVDMSFGWVFNVFCNENRTRCGLELVHNNHFQNMMFTTGTARMGRAW